jgi:hypothetical protein
MYFVPVTVGATVVEKRRPLDLLADAAFLASPVVIDSSIWIAWLCDGN